MSRAASSYVPAVGDYVLVPSCALLPTVAFQGRRPIVQSVAYPNITVAVAARKCVVPERCRDPEHPDCLVSEELAIDCAQWSRKVLDRRLS